MIRPAATWEQVVEVNRGVIVLKAKEPYLDWANACNDETEQFTVEDLAEDSTVYLVPDWLDDEELEGFLRRHARLILENELEAWITNKSLWPERRDYETLRAWFAIEAHSVVRDLGGGPIEVESS